MPKKIQKYDSDFELGSSQDSSQDGKYSSISLEMRISLIKLVLQDKLSIVSAAFELGLNFSTAKYILKSFREKGKIHRKRQDRDKILQEDLLKNLLREAKNIKRQKRRSKGNHKKQKKEEQNEVFDQNIPKLAINQTPEEKHFKNLPTKEHNIYNMNPNLQYFFFDPSIEPRDLIMRNTGFYIVQQHLQ